MTKNEKNELIALAKRKLEAYEKTGLKGFQQQALDYLNAAGLSTLELVEILGGK